MDNQVRFDEEGSAMPVIRPRSIDQKMVGVGVAVDSGQAQIILAMLAALAIGGAIYFMASAVPPPPELGDDRPRPGEKIPSNRSI